MSDMNDTNDTNDTNDANAMRDTPWSSGETRMTRAGKGAQRWRVLLGTAAAVLIVTLLAGALLTRPHGPAAGSAVSTPTPGQVNQSKPTPDQGNYANSSQFSGPAGKCAPGKITATIPAHALLFDLAMISPDEGWAVGAIESSSSSGDPVNALILRYHNCAWAPIAADYPGMTLMSVSMTSATDGWAVGGSSDGKQLALHYTGGTWQSAPLPSKNSFDGVYTSVKMRSADEGWIAIQRRKNDQGISVASLLHLANGHWTAMESPVTQVNDLLPIGPDDAWLAGIKIVNQQQMPALYHYQSGSWSAATTPAGVAIDRLRMVAPNDIWASGHINAPSNTDYEQSAAVLHYDGDSWQRATSGASGHPQFIQAFDGHTGWAFTIDSDLGADTVNGAQYQQSEKWLRVKWPFATMSMGLVPFGMNPMQRVSADEYWSLGVMNPTGGQQATLLYFASGVWHEYGQ